MFITHKLQNLEKTNVIYKISNKKIEKIQETNNGTIKEQIIITDLTNGNQQIIKVN